MKIFATLFICFSILSFSQTTISPGDVSGSWTKASSPYLITGDITIQTGNTLTIEPGVIVEFQGNYKFNVYGRILAIGEVSDSIYFTAQDTSVGWHGIRILNSNSNSMDSSKFVMCNFTAGKALAATTAEKRGGAIYCEQSSDVLIKQCVFKNNYAALDGGAIAFMNNSAAFIDDCLFEYNYCYFYGGCIYIDASDAIIKNTTFRNNNATFFGAAITGWNASAFILENCKIINNLAGAVSGLYTAMNCSPTIINTLFSGNSNTLGAGGGAGFSVSNPTLINCTFTDNSATQSGGGVWLLNSNTTIVNSIFWANSPDELYVDGGTINVTYSDIMGGYTGDGNIDADPSFTLSGDHPYSILESSLCVDAGNPDTSGLNLPLFDLAGNQRISGNRIDIGAYEYQSVVPVELVNFSASAVSNNVTLNWVTVSEENNFGFDIERRTKNSDWINIGFVRGSGTSTQQNQYTFVDSKLVAGEYNYRIKQIDLNGSFNYYNLSESVIISIPNHFELSQNYPNPFNPNTIINFNIAAEGDVTLKIFDVLGREVATLINEFRAAGSYTIDVNAEKYGMISGVYFYTLESGKFNATKKLVVLK